MASAQLLIVVAGFIAILTVLYTGKKSDTANLHGGLNAEQWRKVAAHLAEKNMPLAAVEAYENALATEHYDPAARAGVCYTAAQLAFAGGDPEKGLALLYQAEALAPESDRKGDIDKLIVSCLEKLGRGVDLRNELRKRASLTHQAKDVSADDTVLAELGDSVITQRDLELELEKIPGAKPDQKAEVLKSMAAERLLLNKARRLNLDEDPEVQDVLARQMDALLVRRLLADEVKADVHVTEADAERFYKAEPDRFARPAPEGSGDAAQTPPFDEVKQQAMAMLRMIKEQEHIQSVIDATLRAENVKLHLDRLPKEENGA